MWCYFLVVVGVHANLLEPVPFIEFFGALVRDLNVQINLVDLALVGRRSREDEIEALGAQGPGTIRLFQFDLSWDQSIRGLTASTPIVMR